MTDQRYPADLVITKQDFADSGWDEVLSQTTREGYVAMWEAFSTAACKAIAENRNEHGKVLWLLADACSMMLSPSSQNEPFKPVMELHGRRSTIPDDLAEADIGFFADITDAVDDIWLKARLADLVWLKRKPRDVSFALMAIDAYRAIHLDTETWIRDGKECWERAINLARMLKAGAGDRLEKMEDSVFASFNSATRQDSSLGLGLADLLKTNALGRAYQSAVAQKLETLAREFDDEGDLYWSRAYFSASADWYKTIPSDEAKAAEMAVAVAEDWVKEAIARVSSDNPSHMAAAVFYEKAIQAYRKIPRAERATHRVDERITELRARLNESGEKSLGEMRVISAPVIDISQFVESARKSVSGKSATDALLSFANLHPGAKVDELRGSTLERMKKFPLRSLFVETTMSRDGRVIAKRPPMSLGAKSSAEEEIAIRAEMIRDYGTQVNIVVQGNICPALEVLLLEHRLREADFVRLANQSPIVPSGRAGLFGMALFKGYDRDFVSALHLLIPQIEHMVRVHLKQIGAKTTNLDKDGIENENGLSTLMDLPEVEQVFGKDLTFEIKALFCDASGPNLRNEIAHGLLDQDAFHSPFAIYAWWLGLRLVYNTCWHAAHKDAGAGEEEETNG